MTAPAPIEQALVAHHNGLLSEPVSTRVPKARPDAFVKVTRAGGTHYDLILSDATVLYECWGASDSLAWDLVSRVWAQARELDRVALSGVSVNRVRLTDPVNFPDSLSGSPRYQFIATLTVALEETP